MQIRLTVTLGPRAGGPGAPASRQPGAGTEGAPSPRADVLVTAPGGTPLSAVVSALGSAVASAASGGAIGSSPSGRGGRSASGAGGAQEAPAVYAGSERLDAQHPLGEPPLLDGAVLALHGPVPDASPDTAFDTAKARLHVVAGPDAGGIHLLQGGRVRLGRSAEADVPLDDPDVSRLHCAVTVTEGGTVTVTDLDSTNGTSVDGLRVAPGPVLFKPGSVLRIGESTLRLEAAGRLPGPPGPSRATVRDGEGRLRLTASDEPTAEGRAGSAPPPPPAPPDDGGTHGSGLAPLSLPLQGGEGRRARGPVAWARRFAGPRADEVRPPASPEPPPAEPPEPEPALPDPAAVLLGALGPGPRLWEDEPPRAGALAARLGTAHPAAPGRGARVLATDLGEHGALGLAGPRSRLAGLARSVLAQLAAAHGPSRLEVVLLAADRTRPAAERAAEWSWLGWLPHVHPRRGQDCGLLLALDREQAETRADELLQRLESARGTPEDRTLLVVDGDPGTATLREAVARLSVEGPGAGVHVLCLAETPPATPASPVAATVRVALASSPAFRALRIFAVLSGDVATAVRLVRVSEGAPPEGEPQPLGPVATVDAVSPAWAERFARALAPLREPEGAPRTAPTSPLPHTCRLLDELGLARATPAALRARWAARADAPAGVPLLFGAGLRGPLQADLASLGGTAVVRGPAGSGRSELLRALAASLAAGEPPERLGLLLVDGAAQPGDERGGLAPCGQLPHVRGQMNGSEPVAMREFAQSLGAELKRRAEVLDAYGARTWEQYTGSPSRTSAGRAGASGPAPHPGSEPSPDTAPPAADTPPALPRLAVLVDDFDTLVEPALGNPGRPAAGSVVRALEAVARGGAELGVHLVLTTGRSARAAETTAVRAASLLAELSGEEGGAPRGRGTLRGPQEAAAFQSARVTGRIPRTATMRPTVVPVDWTRAGDPPTRRQVRELGNGPTDLALLTSALERAAGTGAPPRSVPQDTDDLPRTPAPRSPSDAPLSSTHAGASPSPDGRAEVRPDVSVPNAREESTRTPRTAPGEERPHPRVAPPGAPARGRERERAEGASTRPSVPLSGEGPEG